MASSWSPRGGIVPEDDKLYNVYPGVDYIVSLNKKYWDDEAGEWKAQDCAMEYTFGYPDGVSAITEIGPTGDQDQAFRVPMVIQNVDQEVKVGLTKSKTYIKIYLNSFECSASHTIRLYDSGKNILETATTDAKGVCTVEGENFELSEYIGLNTESGDLASYFEQHPNGDNGANLYKVEYSNGECNNFLVPSEGPWQKFVLSTSATETDSFAWLKLVDYTLIIGYEKVNTVSFVTEAGEQVDGFEIYFDDLSQVEISKYAVTEDQGDPALVSNPVSGHSSNLELISKQYLTLGLLSMGLHVPSSVCLSNGAGDNMMRDCPPPHETEDCEGEYQGEYARNTESGCTILEFFILCDEWGVPEAFSDKTVSVSEKLAYQVPAYYYNPDPDALGGFTGDWFFMGYATLSDRMQFKFEKVLTPSDRF